MLKEEDINNQYDTIESIISAFIEHMLISMNKALIFLDEKISRLERILITKKKPMNAMNLTLNSLLEIAVKARHPIFSISRNNKSE